MSIFSGISKLRELRDARVEVIRSGDAETEGMKPWVLGGFWLISLLAIVSLALLCLIDRSDMSTRWAFSVGIEAFSIVCGAIVYYCYMQDPDSSDAHTALFAQLLGADALGMFLDEVGWLVQGRAGLAAVNIVAHALLYLDSCFIVILFWRYGAYMLQIPDQTSRAVNRVLSWLSILVEIVLIANFFTPLLFSVDAQGIYRRGALFPLVLAPLLASLPPLTQGFMRYNGPEKVKKVARLFFMLPLIAVALSCAQFGISLQYSAVLLSILLVLGVVVSDRGKRMSATQKELDMAAQIQESMLPSRFPAFPERTEFDLFASMDSAREVGGDFYDFFTIDDDHLALVMADVSDKGIPAALMMMSAKILLHYRACRGGTPGQILADVNDELCDKNDSGMFVTVWLGILDVRDGTLCCANAGHEYPELRQADAGFHQIPDKHGLPLGAMPGMRYYDYTLSLNPGDAIFVYTDGVPEARNSSNDFYGTERLERALNRRDRPSPQEVLEAVRADVDEFVGAAKQFDDLTMLCLEYRGSAGETEA